MPEPKNAGALAPAEFEAALFKRGALTYPFRGGSMRPFLDERRCDLVTVGKKTGRLQKYDVALYRSAEVPNRYILHRVIRVTPGGYLTRGDHCAETETVEEERVIGVLLSFHLRKGAFLPARERRADAGLLRAYGKLWVLLHNGLRGRKN